MNEEEAAAGAFLPCVLVVLEQEWGRRVEFGQVGEVDRHYADATHLMSHLLADGAGSIRLICRPPQRSPRHGHYHRHQLDSQPWFHHLVLHERETVEARRRRMTLS